MTDSSGPDGIPIVLNSKSDSLSPRQMWEFTPTWPQHQIFWNCWHLLSLIVTLLLLLYFFSCIQCLPLRPVRLFVVSQDSRLHPCTSIVTYVFLFNVQPLLPPSREVISFISDVILSFVSWIGHSILAVSSAVTSPRLWFPASCILNRGSHGECVRESRGLLWSVMISDDQWSMGTDHICIPDQNPNDAQIHRCFLNLSIPLCWE